MKKLSITLLLTLLQAVLTTGTCFAADATEGFWISVDEKTGKATAGWEIYQSGGKLFGKIHSIAGFPQTVKAERCKDTYRGGGDRQSMLRQGEPNDRRWYALDFRPCNGSPRSMEPRKHH
jgi:hypothetical protein